MISTSIWRVRGINGEIIPLQSLVKGALVKGEKSANLVRAVQKHLSKQRLYQVNDLCGITGAQLFMTDEGWRAVDVVYARKIYPDLEIEELAEGDFVHTYNGQKEITHLSLFYAKPRNPLFELMLDGDHTFYLNDYLTHNLGGGGSGGGTTVNRTEPPAYLQPYVTDLAQQAQRAYQEVPQGGFTGDLVAKPTSLQTSAQDALLGIAGGFAPTAGQSALNIAQDQADRVTGGYFRDAVQPNYQGQNLATADLIQTYLAPVEQNLLENILPQVQSEAVRSGAYGGTAMQDVMAQRIRDDYTSKAADIATQLAYGEGVRQDTQRFQDYTTSKEILPEMLKLEQAAALTTPELENIAMQQQMQIPALMQQVGLERQLFSQDALDEAYNKYLLELQTPFAGLDQYAQLIYGAPGGVNYSTGAQPRSNPLMGALGGASSGAMLATALGMSNPATAGISLGAALLGGLFG